MGLNANKVPEILISAVMLKSCSNKESIFFIIFHQGNYKKKTLV